MYVGLIKLRLWIDGSNELKFKSSVVQKIKTKMKGQFNLSISEVDRAETDNTDYAGIGMAFVGNDPQSVQAKVQSAMNFLDSLSLGRISEDKIEVLHYGDEE